MATEQGWVSTEELEARLGQQVRAARIAARFDQATLAKRANVSVGSVKNLEGGKGSSIRTLVRVLRALDRVDWLDTLAPPITFSPLAQLRSKRTATPLSRRRVQRPVS